MRKKTWATGVLIGATAVAAMATAAAMPAASAATTSTATALKPPPVTILSDTAGNSGGDIFISPFGDSTTYANGAEILSPDGKKVVWFHQAPAGQEDADFRTQTYDGQPVLTFWQGTGLGGVSTGEDYIYNDHYKLIATVKAGNGYSADGHEFLITPWNTALIISYATATANLTSIGGPADQTVINGIVQEINIKTGKVLFQWNSADHVPYAQSEQPLPAAASDPWDWFHLNAVKVDTNGNFLIDARDTWTTYEVSPRTGKIEWRLGGKDSSFKVEAAKGQVLDSAGEIFAWQHDPEAHGDGVYTFFDNDAAGTANTATDILVDLPVQPRHHRQAQLPHPRRDADQVRQPAGRPERLLAGQRPAAQQRRPVRRLGHPAVLLGVQRVRQAHLQRRAPGRRQHLPRLPSPLEPRPPAVPPLTNPRS